MRSSVLSWLRRGVPLHETASDGAIFSVRSACRSYHCCAMSQASGIGSRRASLAPFKFNAIIANSYLQARQSENYVQLLTQLLTKDYTCRVTEHRATLQPHSGELLPEHSPCCKISHNAAPFPPNQLMKLIARALGTPAALQDCLSAWRCMQAASFKAEDAMHIAYTACGESAKEDVLVSVKALWLFASLSLARGDHYYHVHVLTDGAMHPDDLSFLQPLSQFKASTHPLFPKAANIFRTCASERLYLHEHAEFKHLDQVMPPPLKSFLWHSVSACGCHGASTVHVSSA